MMDENNLKIINKKLEDIEKKYELLEKDNIEYKEKIERNENNILLLNTQLKTFKKDYKIKINDLLQSYTQLIQKMKTIIENEENIKENLITTIKETEKIFDNKLKNLKDELFISLGEKPKEKREENKNENKEDLFEEIKEDKIENRKPGKNEIFEYKGKNLTSLLESKLINIFFEPNPKVDTDDMNELKKISSAFLIRGKDPLEIINKFFNKNINNNQDVMDKTIKNNLSNKKIEIYADIQDLSLLKKIQTKNINEYIKEFREKYGITKKDFCDRNLTKEIKKANFDEIELIKLILKKLNYIS